MRLKWRTNFRFTAFHTKPGYELVDWEAHMLADVDAATRLHSEYSREAHFNDFHSLLLWSFQLLTSLHGITDITDNKSGKQYVMWADTDMHPTCPFIKMREKE